MGIPDLFRSGVGVSQTIWEFELFGRRVATKKQENDLMFRRTRRGEPTSDALEQNDASDPRPDELHQAVPSARSSVSRPHFAPQVACYVVSLALENPIPYLPDHS